MSDDRAGSVNGYGFRPSLMGAPWEFSLAGSGLDWATGSKSGHVPFRDVRRVRLSYRPSGMQTRRFMTELWAEGAPKLVILSCSWKSLFEQEALDQPYTAFVRALHRGLGQAAPCARFERGTPPLLYWPGLAVFVGVALALAALVALALQSGAQGGGAFIAVFLALFLWRAGGYFRRNRPGVYQPEAPPAELLPA